MQQVLQLEFEDIHTEEKPHRCAQCNFSCNTTSSLKKYIKKHTGAINANTKQNNHTTWKGTRGHTMEKSRTDAQAASIQALQPLTWKFTLWGSTPEKNLWNVSSATMPALPFHACIESLFHTLSWVVCWCYSLLQYTCCYSLWLYGLWAPPPCTRYLRS